MASPLALLHNLSVTGKVAGLGAAGLLATSLVGGIAVAELNAIDTDNGELRADQTAYSLILSLDTRASELKVDAYKALLRPDPQGQVEELEEDVAKPRELLAELAKIPVDEAEAAGRTSSPRTGPWAFESPSPTRFATAPSAAVARSGRPPAV